MFYRKLHLMLKRALQEDVGNGDVTAALLPQQLIVEAEIISREPMLVCGQPWVNEVLSKLIIQLKWSGGFPKEIF
ncbi:nicotinate-nucleotide pyrophosphorylase [Legionella pneumophila]|nr:nicotinate-nucleotide pyrophosphorylase [Legionella pneumophila]